MWNLRVHFALSFALFWNCVLICCSVSAETGLAWQPDPPQIPSSFIADDFSTRNLKYPLKFTYARDLKSWKRVSEGERTFAQIVRDGNMTLLMETGCRNVTAQWEYEDPFQWVQQQPWTNPNTGIGWVDDTKCYRWFEGKGVSIKELWAEYLGEKTGQLKKLHLGNRQLVANLNLKLSNIVEKDTQISDFDLPSECTRPLEVCDGGHLKTIDVYIAHMRDSLIIKDNNVADIPGELGFLCYVLKNGDKLLANSYDSVSWFKLQVYSGWGQYSLCDTYDGVPVCTVGGDGYHVGRSASFESRKDGQCGDNSNIGTWYSLPTGGQCASDTSVIGKDCTWRIQSLMKTISIDCLNGTHGLQPTCAAIKAPASPDSLKIFSQAFENDDSKTGGCPRSIESKERISQVLVDNAAIASTIVNSKSKTSRKMKEDSAFRFAHYWASTMLN